MICFGIFIIHSSESENNILMVIFGALALLYQPYFKIALGRELWNMVDVIVGIGLLASIFLSTNKR